MKIPVLSTITGIAALLLFTTVFQSCKKDKNYSTSQNSHQLISASYPDADSNFVSMEFAEAIAQRLPTNYFGSEEKTYLEEGELREISSSFELKFADDILPAGYIFNYNDDEGYVIISADLRQEPVLAFSSTGSLNANDTIPDGLYEWAGHNIDIVHEIRAGAYYGTGVDLSILQHQYQNWLNLFDDMHLVDPPLGFEKPNKWEDPSNPVDCYTPYYAIKQRLLQTTWGQGDTYNDLVNSSLYCSRYASGKPPTGCVATATAQLLKYWSKPHASYNYSLMSNGWGTNETQKLMRDLGDFLNMDYACGASGANSGDVPSVLSSNFSYTSGGTYGSYTYFDRWNVKSNLDANRIVYFGGNASAVTTTRTVWLFWKRTVTTYGEGHAWLCDGYEAKGNNCHQQFWFHMNWGWENGLYNAWYFENNWSQPVANFQFNRRYIRNIYP